MLNSGCAIRYRTTPIVEIFKTGLVESDSQQAFEFCHCVSSAFLSGRPEMILLFHQVELVRGKSTKLYSVCGTDLGWAVHFKDKNEYYGIFPQTAEPGLREFTSNFHIVINGSTDSFFMLLMSNDIFRLLYLGTKF